jgi:DNA-binding transcriptional ArsR family regulator
MKRVLWWLIAGTRGGINRAKIILALNERPYNANQLTEYLGLDYKTVRHHVDVLLKHGVIVAQGDGYGRMFFLSKDMESSYEEFEEIWGKVGNLGENREKKDIGKES